MNRAAKRTQTHPALAVTLAHGLLLGACMHPLGGATRGHYALDNTPSAACRQNPANCPAALGTGSLQESLHIAATVGGTLHRAKLVWDHVQQQSIEADLVECADGARSTVLINNSQRFKGIGPTEAECKTLVVDKHGRSVTLAMLLGQEMHEEALWCVEQRLRDRRPGGYSLEPRYRYEDGRTTHISPEREAELLKQKRFAELEGTFLPDVVIHAGNPLKAQAVYDFKFPCVNTDRAPPWGEYPEGHTHEGKSQGALYQEALHVTPLRIAPRLGVVR